MKSTSLKQELKFAKHNKRWQRTRDCIAGQDTIAEMAKVGLYIPRPAGFDDYDFAIYVDQTPFFEATSRTLASIMGQVFREDPSLTTESDAVRDFLEVVTIEGDSLPEFSADCLVEAATTDFAAILVTYQTDRPVMALYRAESIQDLRYGIVKNRKGLTYVRLEDDCDTVRELTLVDGFCQATMHRRVDGRWIVEEPIPVLKNGDRLDIIPVFVRGDPCATSLLDPVAATVIKHYCLQARHYDGLSWSTTPRVVIPGGAPDVDEQGNVIPLSMAPGAVWYPPENSKVDVVQASAELPGVSNELDRLEAHIAALGSRITAGEKLGAEAAETVALRHAGENASLAGVVKSVSRWIGQALSLMLDWAGLEDVEFALNTDFQPVPWTSEEVNTLATAVKEGNLSRQTFYEMMAEGGWRDPNISWEEERSRIEAEMADEPTIDADEPDPINPEI